LSHPFFDAQRFPLHLPEAQELLRVLTQMERERGRIEQLYESCLPDPPPLAPQPADLMWTEALHVLTARHRLDRLFEFVLETHPHPAIENAILAVRMPARSPGISGGDDPAAAPDDDEPIVLDRRSLRTTINRLAPNRTAMKAIVVRGEPDSGKSHGRHLFERAAQLNPGGQPFDGHDYRPVTVYLGAGMIFTVDDAVQELYSVFNATSRIPLPGQTTTSAYYGHVWRQLRQVAEEHRSVLWIAVDDLGFDDDGAALLDGEIRVFFDHLVPLLANPPYRTRFRLMLIHYPEGKLPTRWQSDVWAEERTTVADVQAAHVAELMEERLTRHRRTVLRDEIEVLALDMIAQSEAAGREPDGDGRLRTLHDLVERALDRMVGD
jgi:hypothetical protein